MRTEDIPLTLYFGFIVSSILAAYLTVALQALGLPWAPFAAWLCGRSARKKGLDVRRHAVAGALYSALMFCPWIYFILRMNGGNVPTILVRLFYISVFTAWMLGSIFWTFLAAIIFHPGTASLYEFSNPWVVFSYTMYTLVLAKLVAWFVSLRALLKRRRRASGSENRSDAMICREHLTPPAFAAVSMAITLFVIFGLTPTWTSIFGERP